MLQRVARFLTSPKVILLFALTTSIIYFLTAFVRSTWGFKSQLLSMYPSSLSPCFPRCHEGILCSFTIPTLCGL